MMLIGVSIRETVMYRHRGVKVGYRGYPNKNSIKVQASSTNDNALKININELSQENITNTKK